jgi:solute carrier family 13 (sodium-dependent dicarboxylate transporter), member 2/3/5
MPIRNRINNIKEDFINSNTKKENIGLVLGPLLFIVIVFLVPTPQSMISVALSKPDSLPLLSPQIALGTTIWMLSWWITECIPLGMTGLLAPFIFVISGILSINQALPMFADPIIWIFISGFILAAAFQKWGLDKRIAYTLALLYKGNNPKMATFFIACLPVFLLTMVGSITASTAIVFPFVIAFMRILNLPVGVSESGGDGESKTNGHHKTESESKKAKRNHGIKHTSNYAEASFLALGQAATAGAMLLLISTAPNLIAKATVEDFVPGKTISFDDWFIIGTPHAIMGLLVSWTVIFLLIKPEFHSLPTTRQQFVNSLRKMGKITQEERVVLYILVAALFLWIVPSLLRSLYGNNTNDNELAIDRSAGVFSGIIKILIKNVPESMPALMIILSVALLRTKRNTRLLTGDEMIKAVDWNIVALFGGGLVLGLGMETSGLATWIGNEISSSMGSQFNSYSVFAISAIIGFIMSYSASNTASAVITCPIAATLAIGAGLNPIPPIIAAALGCSIPSGIPSTTPPMAIIYSSRTVRILNMLKIGIVSDLIRLDILILIGPILTNLIY